MPARTRHEEPQSGVFLRAADLKVVFVLEADDDARARLVRSLSREYVVHASRDAMAAAEMLGTLATPDLMLVSATLPGIDGFTFVRRMRSFAGFRYVPVIFITPERDARLLARAIGEGARQCITTPIREAELLRRVGACTA